MRGKIEDYYEREMEDMNKISDEYFESGLEGMFKDHFQWIVKDPKAGYDPDADMYSDKQTALPPPPQGSGGVGAAFPYPEQLRHLTQGMGFEQRASERALLAARGDVNAAVQALLG